MRPVNSAEVHPADFRLWWSSSLLPDRPAECSCSFCCKGKKPSQKRYLTVKTGEFVAECISCVSLNYFDASYLYFQRMERCAKLSMLAACSYSTCACVQTFDVMPPESSHKTSDLPWTYAVYIFVTFSRQMQFRWPTQTVYIWTEDSRLSCRATTDLMAF